MPREDSIMHPTITSILCARAVAIIRSASRNEPHLASLMLMPSAAAATRGISAATRQLSSTTTGSTPRRRTAAIPSRSSAGNGCSTNSTPYSFRTGSSAMARSRVQPERVLGQMWLELLEHREDCVGGLAVVLRRIRLTPPLRAVRVGQSDPHDAVVVPATAGDDERVLGLERDDFGGELQGHHVLRRGIAVGRPGDVSKEPPAPRNRAHW